MTTGLEKVKAAYAEAVQENPKDYPPLPPWGSLTVEGREAFIHVYTPVASMRPPSRRKRREVGTRETEGQLLCGNGTSDHRAHSCRLENVRSIAPANQLAQLHRMCCAGARAHSLASLEGPVTFRGSGMKWHTAESWPQHHGRSAAGALTGSPHPPACRHPLPSAEAIAAATVEGTTYRERRFVLLWSRS
jgi:hypothetical protein